MPASKVERTVVSKEVEIPDHSEEPEAEIKDSPAEARKKSFGSIKPEFKRQFPCKILDAKFQTDTKKVTEETRDGKTLQLAADEQYIKHWLLVRFEYADKESGEARTFEQSYSGIREYPNRLYFGSGTNLAALKLTLEAFISVPIESVWEMAKELKDLKCLVKSEPWEFGNRKGFSNKIQDFIEEESK